MQSGLNQEHVFEIGVRAET